MAKQGTATSDLLLLDPTGALRAASDALKSNSFRNHERTETFLTDLARRSSASVCVVDMRTLDDDDRELLRGADCSCLVFGIVVVDSAEAGRDWLARGATDFVVLPERSKELDPRIEAAIAARRRCLAHRHGAAEGQERLRRLAHDLKNPLNAIFGYTELLLMEEGLPEQVRVDMGRVLSNATDLQRKIETLTLHRQTERDDTASLLAPQGELS